MDPVKFFLVRICCRGRNQAGCLCLCGVSTVAPFGWGSAGRVRWALGGSCTSVRLAGQHPLGQLREKGWGEVGAGGTALLTVLSVTRRSRPPAITTAANRWRPHECGKQTPFDLGGRPVPSGARAARTACWCAWPDALDAVQYHHVFARDVGKMGSIRPS